MRLLPLLVVAVSPFALNSCKKGEPVPKLIKDELVKVGYDYQVKGSIHNPSKSAMKDVKVRYLVWRKFKGVKDDRWGEITERTGGEVTAQINYLPAGETVEFTAIGSERVPTYVDTVPDPLQAEIEAKWAD